jgi:hypothetical protein
MNMSNDELVGKARHYLNHLLRSRPVPGLQPEMFTQARVSQVPVVALGCKDREDVMEIFIDPQTGEFLDAIHTPNKPKKRQN